MLKACDALERYLLGFITIDKVLFIVISSIFTQCNIPNSSSLAIAEIDTKAAPNPDWTAFFIASSLSISSYKMKISYFYFK